MFCNRGSNAKAPVVLSLETLSCFKTISRQCFDYLGLSLALGPWYFGLGSCCLGMTAEFIRSMISRATHGVLAFIDKPVPLVDD
jgi:hypothetical protein